MSLLSISPASLRILCDHLMAADPLKAPDRLHAAGSATGEALFREFRQRLAHRTGLDTPGLLDARWLGPMVSEFFADLGWGVVSLVELGDDAILVDAAEWAEAGGGSPGRPSCQFSAGVLSAFFGGIAGGPVAVVETECQGAGNAACRFVLTSDDLALVLRDLVAAGGDWRSVIAAAHPA